MPKHHDSAEAAARDLAAHAMATFLGRAGLRDSATKAIGAEKMAALDAAARQHERRTRR